MGKGTSLDKMMHGKLNALFNRELNRVATNINDANTSPSEARKITIAISFKPDEERRIGITTATVSSKLSASKSVSSQFVFGYNYETNQGEASELNAEMLGQVELEEENAADFDGTSSVIDFRKNKKEKGAV